MKYNEATECWMQSSVPLRAWQIFIYGMITEICKHERTLCNTFHAAFNGNLYFEDKNILEKSRFWWFLHQCGEVYCFSWSDTEFATEIILSIFCLQCSCWIHLLLNMENMAMQQVNTNKKIVFFFIVAMCEFRLMRGWGKWEKQSLWTKLFIPDIDCFEIKREKMMEKFWKNKQTAKHMKKQRQ